MQPARSTEPNHLLAACPAADMTCPARGLELAPMPLGLVLGESGGRVQHLCLPTNCIVSLFMGGPVMRLLLRYAQALITQRRRPSYAIGATRWNSSCAACFCRASTGPPPAACWACAGKA